MNYLLSCNYGTRPSRGNPTCNFLWFGVPPLLRIVNKTMSTVNMGPLLLKTEKQTLNKVVLHFISNYLCLSLKTNIYYNGQPVPSASITLIVQLSAPSASLPMILS